jgi:UDP-N-acetylmuramate--alanine ligase
VTRDAAAIGAGLAPPRPARAIEPGSRVHILGIAGAGASGAALLAHAAGALVSGCDPGGATPYTAAVEAAGIALTWNHDAAHVDALRPDRLAVSKALTAVDPHHPELAAARAAGVPAEAWQQLVADAAVGRRLVAVAGTHGKSTTAGWLVEVLVAAGLDPSAFVGALLPARVTGGPSATARVGGGDAFVVEADEYAGNFDPYRPDVAVLTSAEWDHPDVFEDGEAVVSTFARWLEAAPEDGVAILNIGDPGVRAVRASLSPSRSVLTYRLSDAAADPDEGAEMDNADVATIPASDDDEAFSIDVRGRIVAATPEGTHLEIAGLDTHGAVRTVWLPTAGRHNAANALAVAAAARALDLPPDAIVDGLRAFEGVGRRLEHKGDAAGVTVYDDYGHHPTAIRETIAAIRQRAPGRPVWAVYEPLTYHRTAALLEPFAAALATADDVAIADIWAGRDPDTTIASAAGLGDAVRRTGFAGRVAAPGDVMATAEWLADTVKAGDVVLVMGGGQSYRIGERLLERLGGIR